MKINSVLTCYICGETSERKNVDLIGCLVEQVNAEKRFKEKFNKELQGFLYICPDCFESNRSYSNNVIKKYGMY